jgi:hypothetical protein
MRGANGSLKAIKAEIDRVWERLRGVAMGGRSETDPESSRALETLRR